MARPHATIEARLPELLVRPWRRPFLWLHSRRCAACRQRLTRLRDVERLLRQTLSRPPSADALRAGDSALCEGEEREDAP